MHFKGETILTCSINMVFIVMDSECLLFCLLLLCYSVLHSQESGNGYKSSYNARPLM